MKAYVKPELFYERYELSQHIADCAWELNSVQNVCTTYNGDSGKGLGGYVLFNQEYLCTIYPENTELYCYQNGPEGKNTFRS